VSTKSDSLVTKPDQKISISPNINRYAFTPTDTVKKIVGTDVVLNKSENESAPAGNAQVLANAEKKDEAVKSKAEPGRTFDDSSRTLNDDKINAGISAPKSKASQANYDNYKLSEFALSNKYNYRVVDAQNNPVPFANVMNTRDNIGTYTDIRGNFNLVSSDSILQVQIKSLGYNAANYKLVPSNVQSGDLVLKEAERKETFTQNKKVVSSLSRRDSAEIEEPEVGWGNYNTYVANNIQIPDNVRPKNTRSDVELSFDIDKTGQPINIKVTRSSQCKECDEEAIRLLKEGPKWKRKGKKSKATVSISVDQK
jgi:TonB family protein